MGLAEHPPSEVHLHRHQRRLLPDYTDPRDWPLPGCVWRLDRQRRGGSSVDLRRRQQPAVGLPGSLTRDTSKPKTRQLRDIGVAALSYVQNQYSTKLPASYEQNKIHFKSF